MSKSQIGSCILVRVTFLILMGLTALLFFGLFLAVFVPVVGWYIWRLNDRVAELEAKLGVSGRKPDA